MDCATLERLKEIFDKYSRQLLTIPGVRIVAIGNGFIGVVFENNPEIFDRLPATLDGYPVKHIPLESGQGISQWLAKHS